MTPEQEEFLNATPWMHVYAQYIQHDEARIAGNRPALIALRNAIDQALQTGMDARTEDLFVKDGEGYCVLIQIRSWKALEHEPFPYTADYFQEMNNDQDKESKTPPK